MPAFNDFLNKTKEVWQKIGINQKLTIIFILIALVAMLFFFGNWSQKPEYTLLYSRLSGVDAGKIIELLKEDEIPYQIKNGGSSIYVPVQNVYEMRLKMAKKGIPKGASVGFEIFDKTNIGVTDFVQKLNYLRALEGELTRTILQIDGVENVRVHIVVPEEKLFADQQEAPSASVALKLTTPGMMDMGQIMGIKNLVAGAVEGLRPNRITIVDSTGTILAKSMGEGDDMSELSGVQLGQKKSVENYLTTKVQSLLDGVLGKNNAIVRIDAFLDFDQIERTEEIYDPEKAVVRSEVITSEKSSGSSGSSRGVPGVSSNVGTPEETQQGTGTGEAKKSNKNKEIIKNTYEIDKVVKHVIETVGNIKRISVAVFIKKKEEKDKDGKVIVTNRSAEDMLVYEEIVKNAVGFSTERGDNVVVKETAFSLDASLGSVSMSLESAARKRMISSIVKNVITGLIILAFPLLFLVMLNKIKEPVKKVRGKGGAIVTGVDGEEISQEAQDMIRKAEEQTKKRNLEEEVVKMAAERPEELAQIVSVWLSEE